MPLSLLCNHSTISLQKMNILSSILALKTASIDIFPVYFGDRNILPVSSGINLHLQGLVNPLQHRIAQTLEVLLGEVQAPQDLNLMDQLGEGPTVLGLQLFLHKVPTFLDGIKIRLFHGQPVTSNG
jgi:hypothetical protein